MYTLTRISSVPASPLKIHIAEPDGADAGLTLGGSFLFEAAIDGVESSAGMSEHAARAIMGDLGLAEHFRCAPALPTAIPATTEARPDDSEAGESIGGFAEPDA